MFHYVDGVIAFVVLILVASLFITAATQVVVSFLGLRGANLRRSLAHLLETAYSDQETRHWPRQIAGGASRHPTSSTSTFCSFAQRATRFPSFPPTTPRRRQ